MANTSNCLQLINRMPQQDQDALLARLDELQAKGLSPKEAQLQAAIDVLAQVEGEGQIRKSTPRLIEDIPNDSWLQGKIDYAQRKGRNQWGVPHMSTVTGYFDKPVEVSLRVLSRLKGERDEQNNVREDSLDYIRKNWDEVSQQPPYIEVAYNGEAWISEGNHRIMVAAEKGLQSMPVEIRYFDGGQLRNGPLAPSRIPSLEDTGIRKSTGRVTDTPEFKRWFGDSKVVDAKGRPLVVYHGTRPGNDITEFDESDYDGIYFTPDSKYAESFTEDLFDDSGERGAIYPVYLSIQNPYIVRTTWGSDEAEGFLYRELDRRKLEAKGYDGAMLYIDGELDQAQVFRSTQIKSATGNNGEFNPNEPSILKSVGRPEFYSQLQRSIEQVPERLANMAAPAWKQWLTANAPKLGVKAEEVEWSGIKDYLDLQGKAKLSKDDLARYLDDSGVKIGEVTLGAPQLTADGLPVGYEIIDEGNGKWSFNSPSMASKWFKSRDDAVAAAKLDAEMELENGEMSVSQPKYGQYTLPGGENYREVLITLPGKASGKELAALDERIQELEDDRDGAEYDERDAIDQRIAAVQAERKALLGDGYRSSHWDDANILAHIRVNDRTDADGKRVLFVEEVQSDWGQDGKKRGFKQEVDRGAIEARMQEITARLREIAKTVDETPELQDEWNQLSNEKSKLTDSLVRSNDGVPTAPFVTKTEGWLNLALKRIAMMAVEGGYDKVALVNGEQSADRYSLRKQVEAITATKKADGKYTLLVETKNGQDNTFSNLDPQGMEDAVGKEMAQKIVDATSGDKRSARFSGLDLEVGGEGMKTFYDKLVPQALNKLLPKLGGEKLSKVGIDVGLNSSMSYEIKEKDDGRFALRARADANSLWAPCGVYDTKEQAEERMAELKAESESSEQPAFDVTEKMRETVGQGVALFSPGRITSDEDADGQYDGEIRTATDDNYEPENTVTAYKLFRMDPKRPGQLFPLFVNANKAVPIGEWLKAEVGPMTGDKVKSKLGPLAFRPGWHAGDVPVATHIGLKDAVTDKAPKYRNPEHVWAEVEFADDVDWQTEANKRGTNASGKLVAVKAHITDQIPEGGHYRYKTNPNMTGTWLIGGEMKVVRILSDDEVESINSDAGVADLPRKTPLDLEKYGFADARMSPGRPYFDDLSKLKISTNYQLGDLLKTSKKLSWWSRTIGTQYDLAQKHPQFKRVFDAVQRFINDVSAFATHAADLAPTILPKLETWKDIGKSPLSAADVKALRDPIFGGTLKYTRDEDGNVIETEDVSTAGVVFKDEELRSMFGLNDHQIGLYREFRRATNKSLSDLAMSDMLRYLGKDGEGVRQRAIDAKNLDGALNAMLTHLDQLIEQQPERAKVLEDSKKAIKEKAGQAIGLMARGYAPLSRFGQYTVYAVDANGEQLYFSMFENERDANKMAREMQEQYPDAKVTTGTMSQESYKLFSGVTPETLALFGESLGMEESGVDAKSEVFQAYLKMAKTNRSAMKRLIQRKGIDGFSEDAGRVLAGFVYSNARQISTNLHAGEIGRSASEVTDGDVKDAAIRLMEYVQNPREEAQALRGLMFTQFIGGSIASAMVNMTQPFTMTLPYLSQFDGIAGASKRMAEAVKMASRGIRNDDELAAALKRAEDEGVVSPQEVHQLMAQAQGRGALQSGDGTKAGDAAAKINNAMAKLGLGWGKVFSAAEQFNRRVTFIAAYKLARDQKMDDPMAFAEKAIAETQGVYNKGNKPNWARGAVGGTLFTFKQYSIGYIEFLRRMWGNGPEGKKAVGLALGVLFLASGLGGMPGADDLDDVIDGFMQRVLGRSFDSKQAKKEFIASILGQSGAEFVMSGLSGLPGMPIDVSGRMGLGNLVPGTGLMTKKRDYGRDYLELLGPAGTMFTNAGTAVAAVASGEIGKAAQAVSPVAAQNWVKAVDMATMGYYRDTKGRKVIDTDAADAVFKAIGFQPRSVAQIQEATGTQSNLITQNKLRETEIADKWAQGRIERDPSKIEEAKQELADWNRKNPESPIKIDAGQINKRVQEANKTKAQRVAATAPKEIRGAVKRELEAAE